MNRKQLLTTTIASILATGMIGASVGSAFAMGKTPSAQAATKSQTASDKKAEQELVKVSKNARLSMRDLQNARWAIFNGNTNQAQTFADAARLRIGKADNESEKYALDVKAPKANDSYVPYDAEMTVMDSFQANGNHSTKIARVTKHKHQSEKPNKNDTLKLTDTDVVLSTDMVPVNFAKAHIDHASTLINQGKYYQANLALKAVDDAVFVQSYALEDVPKLKSNHSTIGTTKSKETTKSENS